MNDLNREALRARQDDAYRQRFIEDNTELIVRLAYNATGRYVSKSDDEYSIALIAFNEAIDSYNETKGKFKSFASLVIKRRILDEARRDKGEIPVSPSSFEGYSQDGLSEKIDDNVTRKMNEQSIEQNEVLDEKESIRLEIEEASQIISVYGFTFFELADCSPKSMATKKACKEAIICLLKPGELYEEMSRTKRLPIKELEDRTKIKRKM